MKASQQVIAAFDFDGTLTRRDSLLPFLHWVVGPWRFWWGMIVMGPMLAAYAIKIIPNWQAKEKFLTHFLRGHDAIALQDLATQFATDRLPELLRAEAVQRLHWHRRQGHRIVLVSASLELYLQPWARTMDIEQVLGSQLEIFEGKVTGNLVGKNCYGQEKVDRLTAVYGDQLQHDLYVYGDSRGDRELLAIASFPYYRTFAEATELEDKTLVWHWKRGLILTMVVVAALYLGTVLVNDANQFQAALSHGF